jgi:hypothetical protein
MYQRGHQKILLSEKSDEPEKSETEKTEKETSGKGYIYNI